MASNKFTIGVFVRVGLLLANMILISYTLDLETRFFTLLILLGILTAQTFEMVYYVNKTNRELAGFLDTIKDKDLISKSISQKDLTFKKLNQTFNQVIDTLQQSGIEKETQYNLLNLVVQQAQVGIMLYKTNGKIQIMNPASIDILGLASSCYSIEELSGEKPDFYSHLINGVPGSSTIIEIKDNQNQPLVLSLIKNPIKLMNEPYVLITFQNIGKELEQKEMEAWQNLIRTLSHEIMNSVTPITSLTETSLELLKKNNPSKQGKNRHEKLEKALKAIEKRSSGLYDFVNDVRKVIKLPETRKEKVEVYPFLEQIFLLMEPQLKAAGIQKSINIQPANLTIHADPNQVEQIFINLILNAIEATEGLPGAKITVTGKEEKSLHTLTLTDNGPGIDDEALKKIFIPFYSTKERGSGIGLSLCKQIMQKHQGQLTVKSVKGEGSAFTLWFPKG